MADPGKGRGRGLALLQALKKSTLMDSPPEGSTPELTPAPSASASVVSSSTVTTSMGGRGRLAAMMLAKAEQRPGAPTPPIISPASDMSPAQPRGAGRGIKQLLSRAASLSTRAPEVVSGVQKVTQQMAESTIGDASIASAAATTTLSSVAKNKYFSEVSENPPMVRKGESGRPCDVTSNFIYLKFEENNVFEYEVKYEPDQDFKAMRFKLLNEHKELIKVKVFDGQTMYVPHKLPDSALNLVSTNPYDNSKVNIRIIFRRTRRLSEMKHIYNVLFNLIMKDLELVRFNRQHFNQNAAIPIPQHRLEVWPGYVTAVDEYEGGLMLTLDSTHRVLRTHNVLDFIKETIQHQGANWKRSVAEQLVGCSVMTTYNNKLFRVDTIDDSMSPRSTFEKNDKGQIIKISFLEYYKNHYGIDILDLEQPLLISKESKRQSGSEQPTEHLLCLVPELCRLTGLTDDQRSNFKLMKDVAAYTRITPNQRHKAFKGIKWIQQDLLLLQLHDLFLAIPVQATPQGSLNVIPGRNILLERTGSGRLRTYQPDVLSVGDNIEIINEEEMQEESSTYRPRSLFPEENYIKSVMSNASARGRLQSWGLQIADETVPLTARTLAPEALFFGNNRKVPGKPNAEWNMEVTSNPVMQAVDIMNWTILYSDRDKQVTNDFVQTLKRCCNPMGISVSDPEMIRLANDRPDTYITALNKCISGNIQLVVTICPTSRDDRYASIKKVCCADKPIPSQVLIARTLNNPKKIRAITQKILLQMNCKLGGTLWNINIPIKTAMIVGIDSYHDPSRKKRSVCAFVASYNQTMTHWYSTAVFQERNQEIADCLKSCLVKALQFYLQTNGTLPTQIIMYRDGVGDGQLKIIRDYEIPQMKVCFELLGETYSPSLTYIVVQKRINTRIFLKTGPNDFGNPDPGTVLDHTITRRDWYDFLIASQKVTQGTVTPTHYVVVYDDSGMTPDQCQRLTYKMCHLYYNWPGTVRVPAPCQYAHKLAYLIGQNVQKQPAEALADKLYFL